MSHKEITGFDTIEEFVAYEKGHEDREKLMIEAIENWDLKSTSQLAYLLRKKFNEVKDKI